MLKEFHARDDNPYIVLSPEDEARKLIEDCQKKDSVQLISDLIATIAQLHKDRRKSYLEGMNFGLKHCESCALRKQINQQTKRKEAFRQ